MSRPRRDRDLGVQPANADCRVPRGTTANAATQANADREARPIDEPPDLDPPDLAPPGSEWPEPDWPSHPPGRRPSYEIVLAVSPWYKERYPDQAANLWDALHPDRSPQPAPEPDWPADREAGE